MERLQAKVQATETKLTDTALIGSRAASERSGATVRKSSTS